MIVPYQPPPLGLGSRGDKVFAIKRALVKSKYMSTVGPFPRYFGPRVMFDVKQFQADHMLDIDGQVGPATLQALVPFFDEYGFYLYTGRYPNVPALQLPETLSLPIHYTAGLPGFPANDCFAPAGADVLAPENVSLQWPHFIDWNQAAHVGGWTAYLQGENCTYFVTHFGTIRQRGLYRKGDKIGTVGAVPKNWWPSHIHEGKHQGYYKPAQT